MKHSIYSLALALPMMVLFAGCSQGSNTTGQEAGAAGAAVDSVATEVATAAAEVVPAVAAVDGLDDGVLGGYHWQLAEAKDGQGEVISALLVRADQPVQLDLSKGRLSISNTCNRMNGSYKAEGGQLEFGPMASTMMACVDEQLMALDDAVSTRITGKLAAVLQSGDAPVLTLTNEAGDVLVFNGKPTAETRYGGEGERVFLEVADKTKACNHPLIPDMQCLQVREVFYNENGGKSGTPGEWENFYQDIEGYTHEDGVRNVLRVNRYKLKEPTPADASNLAYVLDMVVESELVKP